MADDNASSVQAVADHIASKCLAARVRMLNRTITAIYDDALRPLGMTINQLNLLIAVARQGPVSPSEVARSLNMDKSTMSRNVKRMRAHGWLADTPTAAGRRRVLTLLPKGGRLLEQALPRWEQAQAQAKILLGERGTYTIHWVANAVEQQRT